MLLTGGLPRPHNNAALDSIHNFYENPVTAYAFATEDRCKQDSEYLADVCCVALNHLPPRYIRHDVDMTFFLSPMELQEIEDKVAKAVRNAIDLVNERDNEKSEENEGVDS